MHAAYYNEHEPYAAQWLRNLIEAGHIAPGDVDERSIEDVHPDDLKPYTQCHFFAGIGVWSLALRRAGWPDDRPVWTGSCPCQPFSTAGEGAGFDDPRHLWPAFGWLIGKRRPPVVLGEQVASKDAEPWLDLVQADVEAMGYAFGAIPFPSSSVGAPHIRDRLFWVADADSGVGRQGRAHAGRRAAGSHAKSWSGLGSCRVPGRMADTPCARPQRQRGLRTELSGCAESCIPCRLANSDGGHTSAARKQHGRQLGLHTQDRSDMRSGDQGAWPESVVELVRASPVNGLWADADWLFCRDGKWRPVEPGTFPLADGAPARVGRLRAYGNAINAEAATQFIAAYMECYPAV
ncbi:DNA cytosine methyltransferase [Pseudomonas kuykendallii]|uniref:DNA (Cytosine-5)-methyltransferase 1 n=1 Tax=Pseudomonas kuykendallii TaxID=1007099 RepID=A0A1H3EMA2_9PSED|nr:DNA cytosine methyltransferase [Pseudomonas kuykendallii]MCQ4271032.1 DNA cytosine methyltransferase [Pseudomonas kuykendallii]SDX79896.1 DNA (cytosine-5)-methyltransferase 1 [Pseudomonas kuykendallii]